MGLIPKGWSVGKISDLANIRSGFTFSSKDYGEYGEFGLVTIKNVQDGTFVTECSNNILNIPTTMPNYCFLEKGDILLSLTGNVGRVAIVYGGKYLLNQRVSKIESSSKSNISFCYFAFRQKEFQDKLISISRGTAQQNLSPVETSNLAITIPALEILEQFSDLTDTIFWKLVDNFEEIKTLMHTRDSLLPKLMSGKIRVNS
jgi:type I restriction enzyme S subunit